MECGKESTAPYPDEAQLQAILGKEVYKAFSKGSKKLGTSRHKLFHGAYVSPAQVQPLLAAAYENVLAYLRQRFKVESVSPIANAPRSFAQYEYHGNFARMTDGSAPDLAVLESGRPTQTNVAIVPRPTNY